MSDSTLDLYPRLTRFYRIGPADLHALPKNILAKYVEMLPVLEAEELLAAIQVTALPYMKEATRNRLLSRLERVARIENDTEAIDPRSADGQKTLAGMGIGFVKEGSDA